MDSKSLVLPDKDYLAKCDSLKADMRVFYDSISKTDTPRFDDTGKKIVDVKGTTGYEYIIDAYMTDRLNFYFPGWSWRKCGDWRLVGTDWVVVEGELIIIDEKLLAFGVIPPFRYYYALNAKAITYKQNLPHTLDNIIDFGNDVVSCNTEAKKVAINRLTGIGDDIYHKRIEGQGVDTIDEVIELGAGSVKLFEEWMKKQRLTWPKILAVKGVREAIDGQDFKEAMKLIKGGGI